MNTDVNVLMKSFNETELMMDALIDRVMARDGIWFKTELAGRIRAKWLSRNWNHYANFS